MTAGVRPADDDWDKGIPGELWVGDACDSELFCDDCIAQGVSDARAYFAANYGVGGLAYVGEGVSDVPPMVVAAERDRVYGDGSRDPGTVWALWLTERGDEWYSNGYVGVHADYDYDGEGE